MGLLVRTPAGFVDSRLQDIDARLKQRDPNLSVQVGRVTTRDGRIVKEKAEVWYRMADGRESCIGWWDMHEIGRIETDVMMADRNAPGHVDVLERIDKANAKKDKDVNDAYADTVMRWAEHAVALHDEIRNGKSFFGQVGRTLPKPRSKPKAK